MASLSEFRDGEREKQQQKRGPVRLREQAENKPQTGI
jgi:hypothetical protein